MFYVASIFSLLCPPFLSLTLSLSHSLPPLPRIQLVVEAPYALEKVVTAWTSQPSIVKLALLAACARLFFKRPGEMQKILGSVLSKGVADVEDQDLHDRALYYHRLLQSGAANAETTVEGATASIAGDKGFAEDDGREARAGLAREFNTLSICYGKTEENFVAEKYRAGQSKETEAASAVGAMSVVAAPAVSFVPAANANAYAPAAVAAVAAVATAAPSDHEAAAAYDDLLGFAEGGGEEEGAAAPAGDLLGGGFDEATTATTEAAQTATKAIALNPGVAIDGAEFQAQWGQLTEAVDTMIPMGTTAVQSTQSVEDALHAKNILTMASGEMPDEFKFFLYAQHAQHAGTKGMFLIEAVVDKTCRPQLLAVKIKTDIEGGRGRVLAEEVLNVLKAGLGC